METAVIVGIISASSGIIGACVGAGIAVVNGWLQGKRQREADSLRWVRESQVRYNADRVLRYSNFLRLGHDVTKGQWLLATPDISEFTVAYYSVELLASPLVRAAAKGYYKSLERPYVHSRLFHGRIRHQESASVTEPAPISANPVQGPTPNKSQVRPQSASALDASGFLSLETRCEIDEARSVLMQAIRDELGVEVFTSERVVLPTTRWYARFLWPLSRRRANKTTAALVDSAEN